MLVRSLWDSLVEPRRVLVNPIACVAVDSCGAVRV